MSPEFMAKLRSGTRGQRLQAWNELHDQPEASCGTITTADRQELHQALHDEDDDAVIMEGMMAMVGLGSLPCIGEIDCIAKTNVTPTRKNEPESLDNWLVKFFKKPSALLGVTQEDYRRDEDALAHLARRFPPWLFTQTDIKRVRLGDDSWFQLFLDHSYETVLVIGRLWMFGPRALQYFAPETPHFEFPATTRPKGLKPGEINPEYHCIHELRGDKYYRAEQNGNVRTDYGLVQIYPARNGRRWMTVVSCAGCSSLGTRGAASWLTYDLPRAHNVDGNCPIPAPPGINARSPMEALIKVVADSTAHAWEPSHIELCRLYVDDLVWCSEDLQWQNTKQHEITVVIQQGHPVSLLIDDREANLKSGSQNFRLATEMAWAVAKSSESSVPVATLAKNRYIWEDREMEASQVKRRLHYLRNNALKGTVIVGDDVRLDAVVKVTRK